MLGKNYKLLVIGLLLCTVKQAAAFGGGWDLLEQIGNNPAFQNAVQAVGNGMATAGRLIGDGIEAYAELSEKQFRELKEEQQRILQSDTASPEEKAMAQEILREIQEASLNTTNKASAILMSGMEGLVEVTKMGAQGIVQEGLAQLSHGRKLDEIAQKGMMKRKQALAVTQEYIKSIKENPALIVGTATGISAGLFGSYFVIKHGVEHISAAYKKPTLADPDKTSIKFGLSEKLKSWVYGSDEEPAPLSDVILKPEIADQVDETVKALKNTVKKGGYLKHLLLWGQPGTGKTMLAMRMARSCGLEYIYFQAGNLAQLSLEEASRQLIELFRFAQNHPRKLMIIIDEAEWLMGSRKKMKESNSVDADMKLALLSIFLGYTGTESRDFMVVALTNLPEDLDEAFLDRVDDMVQIAAPGVDERRAILQLYVDKYLKTASNLRPTKPSIFSLDYWFKEQEPIVAPAIEEGALSDEELDRLAEQLDGFVGRAISKLVIQIQSSAFASDNHTISKELIDRVVKRRLKQRRDKEQGFVRDTAQAA